MPVVLDDRAVSKVMRRRVAVARRSRGFGGRAGAAPLEAGDYGLGRHQLHRAQRHVQPVRLGGTEDSLASLLQRQISYPHAGVPVAQT